MSVSVCEVNVMQINFESPGSYLYYIVNPGVEPKRENGCGKP
jgi:hypothetical protein